jgi:hypothetical protein
VAVSVLGHVALFSYLGLRSMGLTLSGLVADPDPVIYVEITPRPLLPGEVARVRAVPEPPQVTSAPALPGSPTADPDRPFRNPDDEDSPAQPAPRMHIRHHPQQRRAKRGEHLREHPVGQALAG